MTTCPPPLAHATDTGSATKKVGRSRSPGTLKRRGHSLWWGPAEVFAARASNIPTSPPPQPLVAARPVPPPLVQKASTVRLVVRQLHAGGDTLSHVYARSERIGSVGRGGLQPWNAPVRCRLVIPMARPPVCRSRGLGARAVARASRTPARGCGGGGEVLHVLSAPTASAKAGYSHGRPTSAAVSSSRWHAPGSVALDVRAVRASMASAQLRR